jgi:RNA polymerase sigma-70 factor (ECF subfamily)
MIDGASNTTRVSSKQQVLHYARAPALTVRMPSPAEIERVFRERQRMLWGLCYRLTGVAADADELVQETFVRALARPPPAADGDWHRWLVRVATNLSLDRLRARRRRAYVGPWLPAPIEVADADLAGDDVAAGYARLESVSYAFLLALEVLAPRARAVLLLRDVFDHSAAEVASLLATSEANVRVVHHRARQRLAAAHPDPRPLRDLEGPTRAALAALVDCMLRQDAAGMRALLAASVRTVTDGGGEYTALRVPLVGVERVARFHLETGRRRGPISLFEIRAINGLPALVVETRPLRPQMAPRLVLRCDLDRDGRIRELHTILVPRKLTAVRFSPAEASPQPAASSAGA